MTGFLIALVCAPFAAAADAPFAPDPPPRHVVWFQDLVGPALTFASPTTVLHAWQIAVAAALVLTLVASWPLLARLRGASGVLFFAWIAYMLLAAHTLGILLESATFGWGAAQTVGFALYWPAMVLEPLALAVTGILCLRSKRLHPAAGWAWALAPLALVISQLLFFQFPGGSAPGLALPWMIAAGVRAVKHAPAPRAGLGPPAA